MPSSPSFAPAWLRPWGVAGTQRRKRALGRQLEFARKALRYWAAMPGRAMCHALPPADQDECGEGGAEMHALTEAAALSRLQAMVLRRVQVSGSLAVLTAVAGCPARAGQDAESARRRMRFSIFASVLCAASMCAVFCMLLLHIFPMRSKPRL